MIKRILSTFINSYAESLKLQERYRLLVTRLGWVTVAISCLALVFVMYHTRLMFGLPLEGGSLEGLRLRMILWIVVVVVLVPFVFFAGMVFMNGLLGLAMFALGRLTWAEFAAFSWHAKYPASWYKPDVTTH